MFTRRGKTSRSTPRRELERREQERIEGERGASELGVPGGQSRLARRTSPLPLWWSRSPPGVAFTLKAMKMREAKPTEAQQNTSAANAARTPASPPAPSTTAFAAGAAIQPVQASAAAPAPATGSRRNRRDKAPPSCCGSGVMRGWPCRRKPTAAQEDRRIDGDAARYRARPRRDLQQRLQPMRLNPSFAGILPTATCCSRKAPRSTARLRRRLSAPSQAWFVSPHAQCVFDESPRRAARSWLESSRLLSGWPHPGKARIFRNWSRVETPARGQYQSRFAGHWPTG